MDTTWTLTDQWMDQENVIYTYNGILFSLKKEGNPVIFTNMYGPGEHYTKWSKPNRKTNTVQSHLYIDSK